MKSRDLGFRKSLQPKKEGRCVSLLWPLEKTSANLAEKSTRFWRSDVQHRLKPRAGGPPSFPGALGENLFLAPPLLAELSSLGL